MAALPQLIGVEVDQAGRGFPGKTFTRRLHEWRSALGSETRWNCDLGRALLASHAPVLDWTRSRLFGES